MKIYTKICIDIETGETISEEFFEYDGPLALCWDGDTGGEDPSMSDSGYGGGMDYGGEDPSMTDFGGWSAALSGLPTSTDIVGYDSLLASNGPAPATMSVADAIADLAALAAINPGKKGLAVGLSIGGIPGALLGGLIGAAWGAAKTGMQYSDVISSLSSQLQSQTNVSPQAASAISGMVAQEVQEAISKGASGEKEFANLVSASQNPTFGYILNATTAQTRDKTINVDMAVDAVNAMVQAKEQGLTGSKAILAAQKILTSKYGNKKGDPQYAFIGTYNAIGNIINDKSAWNSLQKVDASTILSGSTGTPAQNTTTGETMPNQLFFRPLQEQLQSALGGQPATQAETDRLNSIMDNFEKVNTDIKFIHDLTELEGVTLSDEEKGFLETMRQNATTNLTDAVNESTIELAEQKIADLVNRGVLQGNIGSEAISKIYEKAGKVVGEQSRNIESDIANIGFQTLEQKKANQMNLWGKELEADIASATTGTDKWKSMGLLETTSQGMKQDWNQSLINALTTMRGQDISKEIAGTQAGTSLSLANKELDVWKDVNKQSNWANIGAALINAWS